MKHSLASKLVLFLYRKIQATVQCQIGGGEANDCLSTPPTKTIPPFSSEKKQEKYFLESFFMKDTGKVFIFQEILVKKHFQAKRKIKTEKLQIYAK